MKVDIIITVLLGVILWVTNPTYLQFASEVRHSDLLLQRSEALPPACGEVIPIPGALSQSGESIFVYRPDPKYESYFFFSIFTIDYSEIRNCSKNENIKDIKYFGILKQIIN